MMWTVEKQLVSWLIIFLRPEFCDPFTEFLLLSSEKVVVSVLLIFS